MRLILALLAALWVSGAAAQQQYDPGGKSRVTLYCNNPGASGQAIWGPCNATNPLQVTASVSASVTGFAPVTTGTPISVTTGGVTGTLPAGTVVVASNVGTTNIAYCKLGASATTSDQPISPNGGWFAFTVGAATQLTCITSTSTTTVNMVGGSGLATGTGGGGGGSGGGAVTVADGADVTQGAIADAAATQGSTGTVSAKLRTITSQLNTISTNTGAAVPAGSAIIGKVGVDQTTPGTTNGVAIVGVNAATALAGNGVTGTGSQRVTIASDNTAFPTIPSPTASSSLALTSTSCGSAVSSCVLKASAGNLYGAYAQCTSACWLMVFNATSAPSNGATTAGSSSGNLVECIDISAASGKSITYPIYPRAFSVGITVAISSTACATLTLSTVGFVSGSVL